MSRNFTHSRKPIILRAGSTRPEADSEPEVEVSTPSSSANSSVSASTGDDPFRDASESDSEVEEDDEGFGDVERWDVLGLGQAMVTSSFFFLYLLFCGSIHLGSKLFSLLCGLWCQEGFWLYIS